jgi:O-antigen/teichoic acid export membrane protein
VLRDRTTLNKIFQNVVRLAAGDFLAKGLSFFAFVYLARVLGAGSFGVLEFANATLLYFLLLADGGLEMWGTREAAKTEDVAGLISRILPLRVLLAAVSFAVLFVLLPVFPHYPQLRTVLLLFGLTVFPQAISLKWLLVGKERMGRVASGLVLGQLIFAIAIIVFIHDPGRLLWVPLFRFAGEVATAAYFGFMFTSSHPSARFSLTIRGAKDLLRPALTIGMSQAMGLLTYNLDSILLGFLTTATIVGWYSAAYKPVTVALTVAMTYFTAVFPAMSRSYGNDRNEFRELMLNSVRLCTILVVPVAVGGTFLAAPIISLLYGPAYARSAAPFQILVWSAALATIRCNFSNALRGTGFQRLDLRCAFFAAGVNIALNFLLIPRYGMIGAAVATVVADVTWLTSSYRYFRRQLSSEVSLSTFGRPLIAATLMGCFLAVGQSFVWPARAAISALLYFAVLFAIGETTVRNWAAWPKNRFARAATVNNR